MAPAWVIKTNLQQNTWYMVELVNEDETIDIYITKASKEE